MALPSEGLLTLRDVNIELKKNAEAHITMNDSDVRSLANVPDDSTPISFDDLRGKHIDVKEYIIYEETKAKQIKELLDFYKGDLSRVALVFDDAVTNIDSLFEEKHKLTKSPYSMTGNNVTSAKLCFCACSKLKTISDKLLSGLTKLQYADNMFMNSYNITEIPGRIFSNNPLLETITEKMFWCNPAFGHDIILVNEDVFKDSNIKYIRCDLRNDTSINIINNIPSLIEVTGKMYQGIETPEWFFSGNINLQKAENVFADSKISYVPENLFSDCPNITSLRGCFKNSLLKEISSNLFKGLYELNDLYECFYNTKITSIPGLLFNDNVVVEDITGCFEVDDVSKATLVNVPDTLFSSFQIVKRVARCFRNQQKIITNLPKLWDREMETYGAYATNCINALNYNEIPKSWGGGASDVKKHTFANKADFDAKKDSLVFTDYIVEFTNGLEGETIQFPTNIGTTPKQIIADKCTSIDNMFKDCTSLTKIESTLFSGMPNVKSAVSAFENTSVSGINYSTFLPMTKLTVIDRMFAKLNVATIASEVMKGFPNVVSAKELFAESQLYYFNYDTFFETNTLLEDISGMFSSLKIVSFRFHNEIFYPLVNLKKADYLFKDTTPISSVGADIFIKNTKLTSLRGCFQNTGYAKTANVSTLDALQNMSYCYSYANVKSFPEGMLNSNTNLVDVSFMFNGNSNMTTGDITLFKLATKINNFESCFNGCKTYTSALPNAWETHPNANGTDYAKGCINASNYADIPETWGGAKKESIIIKFTSAADFVNRRQQLVDEGKTKGYTYVFPSSVTGISWSEITNMTSTPDKIVATGLTSTNMLFGKCTNLTDISPDLFKGCPNIISLSQAFRDTAITKIPDGLFDPLTKLSSLYATFLNCTNLNYVPENLFKYNTKLNNVSSLFHNCTSLENIPPLFLENNNRCDVPNMYSNTGIKRLTKGMLPKDMGSEYTSLSPVNNCSKLIEVDENLFEDLTQRTFGDFRFTRCTSLKTIPDNLFKNIVLKNLNHMFNRCTSLEYVSPTIFDNFTTLADISYCFQGCTSLTHIPELWLRDSQIKGAKTNYAYGCINADNYESVPTTYGGLTIKTYGDVDTLQANIGSLISTYRGDLSKILIEITSGDSLYNAFNGKTALKKTPFKIRFTNSAVINYRSMFASCSALTEVSPKIFSELTLDNSDFYGVFANCTSLTSIPDELVTQIENTIGFTDVGYCFSGCTKFTGKIPEVWINNSSASHSAYAKNCTGASNYSSIPAGWK